MFLVLLFPLFSLAQDTVKIKIPDLEDLINTKVYSASKSKQTVSEAPANIIVITSDQIASRGYRTIEEVLKDLPGFDFSTGQPAGEYPSHFLFRGMGDVGQTKFVIMVDGVPQNDISNGWARNIGFNFMLNDVERIEFVSGPGSALYGLNAFAGFINVITKNNEDQKESISLKATLNGGTYNTYNPELFLQMKGQNGLRFQLGGRYYYSLGDKGLNRLDPGNYFNNNYEPDSVLTLTQGIIANDGLKLLPKGFNNSVQDYYLRGKLSQGGFSLSFNFWDKEEGMGSEVVGYEYFTNTEGMDYQVHHRGKTIAMMYDYKVSSKLHSLSKLYYVNTSVLPETGFTYTYQYQSVDNGIDTAVKDLKKSYKSEGFMVGVEQQFAFNFSERNQFITAIQAEQKIREYFNIAVDALQDRNSNVSNKPGQLPQYQPVYYSKNGAFLIQDEHRFTENIKLTVGARYDFSQLFGNVLNPRLALVYFPSKGLGGKLLYSHGFKAPTIFELRDEWRGNDELIPERIQTTELELNYNIPKRLLIKMNMYHNMLHNLITVAPNPDTVKFPIGLNGERTNVYQNLGSKQIIGLSFNANFKINDQLEGYINYNFNSSEQFKVIDNISMHKVNIGITYVVAEMINIDLRANIVGKTKAPITNRYFYPKTTESIAAVGYDYVTASDPNGYLEGFTVLNLNISTKNILASKKYSLTPNLLIKNLLNKQYVQLGRQSGDGVRPIDDIQSTIRNPIGFIPAYHPQAGIEVFVGLKFGF
ncbi:MAG: TonB-dependent receptor [Flavobacteriales bacterium]|nr:TonB-dependent receptor [Flavobacteriales bacterium]